MDGGTGRCFLGSVIGNNDRCSHYVTLDSKLEQFDISL